MAHSSTHSSRTRRIFYLGIMASLIFALPAELLAQATPTFTPLTSIPFVDYTNITSFVNGFMRLLFVIAALLAVGMIIWGGFLYLTTESSSGKGDAKGKISDALIGLALLLISVLLLTIINPDILNIRLFSGVGAGTTIPNSPSAPSVPNSGGAGSAPQLTPSTPPGQSQQDPSNPGSDSGAIPPLNPTNPATETSRTYDLNQPFVLPLRSDQSPQAQRLRSEVGRYVDQCRDAGRRATIEANFQAGRAMYVCR